MGYSETGFRGAAAKPCGDMSLTDPLYRAFVQQLVALRRSAGLTQADLADRLGKPQSYVSKTERMERRLDPAEFCAWVVAAGGEPGEEFGRVCEAAKGG